MSTAHIDIGYDLIDGIFTVLDGNVIVGGVSYPVYKSIAKPSGDTYVHIHNLLSITDGTKEDFVYEGTIQIEVVNEGLMRIDKRLAQRILGVVRGLLKPARLTTFAIGALTLVVFSPGTYGELEEPADNGTTRLRLIDTYNFLIE